MRLPALRKFNPAAMFYMNLCLLISLVIVAIYLGIYLRNNRLLLDSVKQQAAAYFDLIVRVRRWNAGFGGIYVEKRAGVESNPYLREVGIEPDVPTADGRIFTLKNPALMTKEVSRILSEHNGIAFHITSLKLLNQENAPDPFEQRALESFEKGGWEFFEIEQGGGGPLFRYMAPLVVEQSCQKCHVKFAYAIGDIRGGISVSIPFAKIEQDMALNRQVIIALSFVTLTLLLVSAYLMLNQLIGKIETVQRALLEASITDELTGLRNRRFLMARLLEEFERARRQGTAMGFLMIDLDHFKGVNDNHGHPVGDLVLKSVAQAIPEILRDYDIAGRYGGEEFSVVAPGINMEGLVALAERIRKRIEELAIHDNGLSLRVTVSIGASSLVGDDTVETLLARADDALYQAKRDGRNCTVLL
jgi:diguanylate cyclase (GGDEF)-like protein